MLRFKTHQHIHSNVSKKSKKNHIRFEVSPHIGLIAPTMKRNSEVTPNATDAPTHPPHPPSTPLAWLPHPALPFTMTSLSPCAHPLSPLPLPHHLPLLSYSLLPLSSSTSAPAPLLPSSLPLSSPLIPPSKFGSCLKNTHGTEKQV